MHGLALGLPGPAGPGGLSVTAGGRLTPVSPVAPVKAILAADSADCSILFLGDSTGNEGDEWIRLATGELATLYPAFTVTYQLNDGAGYGAAETVQTGTGSHTLAIYNSAAGGARLAQWMGSAYATAIGALDPDLIVINHGKNSSYLAQSKFIRNLMLQAIQQILLDKPGTPIVLVSQNPDRDDDAMVPVHAGILEAQAHFPGMVVPSPYDAFIARGKAASLYADAIHPSAAGTALYVNEFMRVWAAAAVAPPADTFASWLAGRAAVNVLPNGDLSDWTGALPAGFFEGGTGTITKDTTFAYPGKSWSAKISSTSTKLLRWIADASALAQLKTGVHTLAARVYVETAADDEAGRLIVQTNGDGYEASVDWQAIDPRYTRDGWCWQFIDRITIPADATFAYVTLYGGVGVSATSNVWLDELALWPGDGRPD